MILVDLIGISVLLLIATTFFRGGLVLIRAKGRYPVGVFRTRYVGEGTNKYDPQQVVVGSIFILFSFFLCAVSIQILLDAVQLI